MLKHFNGVGNSFSFHNKLNDIHATLHELIRYDASVLLISINLYMLRVCSYMSIKYVHSMLFYLYDLVEILTTCQCVLLKFQDAGTSRITCKSINSVSH